MSGCVMNGESIPDLAANFLSKISAASNGESSGSGFTYGVLMANELNRAADIRESLRK